MSMKCFVAMAFGKEDAGRVYDNLICPVLKERGIAPVRVDRLEHNENIDDKMMQALREADFVIADLTYARPSVYFEAGYAEPNIPVIYTVRRDHLAPKAEDQLGNFRVHFDLLMRNIIDWTDPEDALFNTRLARRVGDVLAPIHAKFPETDKQTKLREKFGSLSYEERCMAVKSSINAIVRSPEFKLNICIRELHERVVGDTLECLNVRFVDSRGVEQDHREYRIRQMIDLEYVDLNVDGAINRISQIREHYLACFLEALPSQEREHALPTFRKGPIDGMLLSEDMRDMPVVSFEPKGPVYYPVFGKTFLGSGIDKGVYLKNPPSQVSSSDPKDDHRGQGFKIVRCETRKVPRMRPARRSNPSSLLKNSSRY